MSALVTRVTQTLLLPYSSNKFISSWIQKYSNRKRQKNEIQRSASLKACCSQIHPHSSNPTTSRLISQRWSTGFLQSFWQYFSLEIQTKRIKNTAIVVRVTKCFLAPQIHPHSSSRFISLKFSPSWIHVYMSIFTFLSLLCKTLIICICNCLLQPYSSAFIF